MKRSLLFFFLIVRLTAVIAQAPNMFRYQGVARNSVGAALTSSTIKLRLTIREGSAGGTPVYTEVRVATTDARGLFTANIGSVPFGVGNGQTGQLSALDWSKGTKFLQVEMDPTNGSVWTNMGTVQLASSPTAKYADVAGSLASSVDLDLANMSPTGAMEGQVLRFNGTNWVPAYLPTSTFALPYTGTATTTAPALSINNMGKTQVLAVSGVQNAMVVSTTSGTAIGANNATATAPAVSAKNYNAGVAVTAQSVVANGNAMKIQTSNGATALDVNGKVRISGGNTSPIKGGVLMTDASGFARWRPRRIGFHATSQSTFPLGGTNGVVKPQLTTETFDLGGNYTNVGDTKFTAPVKGLYSFKADAMVTGIDYTLNDTPDLWSGRIEIRVFRNGSQIDKYEHRTFDDGRQYAYLNLGAATEFYLEAGDVVDMVVSAAAEDVMPGISNVNFSGMIQFTDY